MAIVQNSQGLVNQRNRFLLLGHRQWFRFALGRPVLNGAVSLEQRGSRFVICLFLAGARLGFTDRRVSVRSIPHPKNPLYRMLFHRAFESFGLPFRSKSSADFDDFDFIFPRFYRFHSKFDVSGH